MEKGIRLESGAIPVAVSSYIVFRIFATVLNLVEWEGVKIESKPEDLPLLIFRNQAFG